MTRAQPKDHGPGAFPGSWSKGGSGLIIDNSRSVRKIGIMEDNMATEKTKIVTYITLEADKQVEAFMKKSGLTKSKTCALAIQTGIQALAISVDPDWKSFFESKLKVEIEKDK